VYDRFGLHHNEVKPLLGLAGVDYYPFTRKLCLLVVPLALFTWARLLRCFHSVPADSAQQV
jgi:hypothetical protein